MVRRLVEQQQIRVAAEGSRERGTRELAAGECLEGPVEIRLGEAEPTGNGGGALAPGVAAGVLEPRLRVGVASERRLVVLAGRHPLLQVSKLALGRDEVGGAGQHVLAQRQTLVERRPLVMERDARPLGEHELAALVVGLAVEDPQQRRLAGAVRSRERDPLAALDLERDAVEELPAGKLLAELGCDHQGHADRVEAAEPEDYEVAR